MDSQLLVDGYSYKGHSFRWMDCSDHDKPRWFEACIQPDSGPETFLKWDSEADWQPRHFNAVVDAGGVSAVRSAVFDASGWAFALSPEHIDRWVIPLLGECEGLAPAMELAA